MRCGYCGITEEQSGAELTYDHFQPQSRGGSDDADNLVYSCHACNEFKGEYWDESDTSRLLHPLRDDLQVHLRQRGDGTLEGVTPLGELFIRQLQLNRSPLVLHRRSEQRDERAALHAEASSARIEDIQRRLARVENRLRLKR